MTQESPGSFSLRLPDRAPRPDLLVSRPIAGNADCRRGQATASKMRRRFLMCVRLAILPCRLGSSLFSVDSIRLSLCLLGSSSSFLRSILFCRNYRVLKPLSAVLLALSVTYVTSARADTVTDDFNRANGDAGANWTNAGDASGQIQIVSNVISNFAAPHRQASSWTGDTFGNDQYAQFELISWDATPSGAAHATQLVCRASGSFTGGNFNGYMLVISPAADTYNVFQNTNNGFSSLVGGSQSLPASVMSGDVYRIECEGTTIRVFQNDTLVNTVTDGTHTSGDLSFGSYVEASSGDDPITMDSFQGGDYPPSAALLHYYRSLLQ